MKIFALVLLATLAGPASAADEAARKRYTQAVMDHVDSLSAESEDGSFRVTDKATRKSIRLSPKGAKVHSDKIVRLGGGTVFACSDFKMARGKGVVDLDFYVTQDGEVKSVLVHKVDGVERYTYDSQNRMVPAAAFAPPARTPSAGGGLKPVKLPGSEQGGQQPAQAGQGQQPPVQMPALPPGISIPGMGSGASQEHPAAGHEHPQEHPR